MVTTKGTRQIYQCPSLQRCDKLTIFSHGLPKGRADTEYNPGKYVLKTRQQEESRIFGIPYIGLLGIESWRDEPWHSLARSIRLQDA